jgi:hypothetical protein
MFSRVLLFDKIDFDNRVGPAAAALLKILFPAFDATATSVTSATPPFLVSASLQPEVRPRSCNTPTFVNLKLVVFIK